MRRAILSIVLGLSIALCPVAAAAEDAGSTGIPAEVDSQATLAEGEETANEAGMTHAPAEANSQATVADGGEADDEPLDVAVGESTFGHEESDGTSAIEQADPSGDTVVDTLQDHSAVAPAADSDGAVQVQPDGGVQDRVNDGVGENVDDVADGSAVAPEDNAATPEGSDGAPAQINDESRPIVAQADQTNVPAENAQTNAPADNAQTNAPAENVQPIVPAENVRTIAPTTAADLRVSVSSGANGEAVKLSAAKTLLGEYWRTILQSDGSYAFASLLGHGWLSWSGAAKAGAKVVTNTKSAYSWLLEDKGGGNYSIAPKGYAALRLALSGTASEGGGLWLAKASEGDAKQLFSLKVQSALTEALNSGTTVSDGPKTLRSDYRTNRYLDIRHASKDNSADAMVYASTGSLNQTYVFTSVGNGLYTIQAAHSGKLIEVQGGSAKQGAAVIQYARNGKLHQFWYLVKDGKGYSIRNAKSGLAFTASAITANPANNVHLESVGKNAAKRTEQRFFLANTSLLANASVYSFAPAYVDAMLVQVAGNSTAKGSNVQIGKTSFVLGQYWRVKLSGDGSFSLINLRSNKALASVGTAKHRANVQMSDNATGTPWVACLNDDASITIRPKSNLKLALDIFREGRADGTNVWLYNVGSGSGTPSKAQRFSFAKSDPLTEAVVAGKPIVADGYTILLESNKAKSLDIKSASMANSAQVVLYAKGAGLDQRFQIGYAGNGLYVIQNAKSGKYVEVSGGSTKSGAMVKQYKFNGKLHQYWYLVKNGTGYSIRNAKSGLALRLEGGKKSDGTRLQVAKAKNEAPQRYTLSRTGLVSNGTYGIATSIVNPLVLDVSSKSKASGANVALYIANGQTNQQFVLRRQSDGTYTIQNKNSGRFLEVKGKSKSDAANIQQGTNDASKAQRWRIVVSPQGGLAFKSEATGKYMEFKNGAIRLGTNVQQTSKNATMAQSFVTVKAGYNPIVGKIGWQNPSKYYQVSRYSVTLPPYARNSSHSYVSPSTLRVDATRSEAVEAFVRRAQQYLGTPYVWDYARKPGGGVDCAGLVLQCLYAVGIVPNKYTPYDHYYTPGHDHYAVDMRNDSHFKSVSFSSRQRGDLVFYEGHVAIYIGNDKIIHAYPGTGVAVASVYSLPVLRCKRVFN